MAYLLTLVNTQFESSATYLDFSGNNLGAHGCAHVLRMLAENSNYTELVRL